MEPEREVNQSAEVEETEKDYTNSKLFPIFGKNFKPKTTDPLKSIQLAIQKSTPPKKKRSLLARKETPGLNQMVLDAGQKLVGPRVCVECGLLYSPGDFEDEEEHRKAHAKLDNLFSITLWKNPQILHHYAEGGFIVMVQSTSDSKHVLNRLQDFLAWLDSELGTGFDPSGSNTSARIFLFVYPGKRKNTVRILGCAVMEILSKGKVEAFSLSSKEPSNVHNTSISVGITRLWTDPAFRKRKIATRLCEMIRFHSGIPGCIISKNIMGILEPSDDGHAFMTKYTEGTGALYTYRSLETKD